MNVDQLERDVSNQLHRLLDSHPAPSTLEGSVIANLERERSRMLPAACRGFVFHAPPDGWGESPSGWRRRSSWPESSRPPSRSIIQEAGGRVEGWAPPLRQP